MGSKLATVNCFDRDAYDALCRAVAVRVADCREDGNLSQRALARRVNCRRERVVALESGLVRPTLLDLVRFSRALGVGVADLLGGVE